MAAKSFAAVLIFVKRFICWLKSQLKPTGCPSVLLANCKCQRIFWQIRNPSDDQKGREGILNRCLVYWEHFFFFFLFLLPVVLCKCHWSSKRRKKVTELNFWTERRKLFSSCLDNLFPWCDYPLPWQFTSHEVKDASNEQHLIQPFPFWRLLLIQ